jgi:Uma2 family endonuclease
VAGLTGRVDLAILIFDPEKESRVRKLWPDTDDDRWTEVWDGVTVTSPLANNEHQEVVGELLQVLRVLFTGQGGVVLPGVNLSDRTPDWTANYRCPDAVVLHAHKTAVDHGTHRVGGPDLAVEVISPGENSSAKFTFYESVTTREVLVIDRDPWAVTLYALAGGKLTPVPGGASALGMTFDLVPGTPRPRVRVLDTASGREWVATATLR